MDQHRQTGEDPRTVPRVRAHGLTPNENEGPSCPRLTAALHFRISVWGGAWPMGGGGLVGGSSLLLHMHGAAREEQRPYIIPVSGLLFGVLALSVKFQHLCCPAGDGDNVCIYY